LEKAEHATLSRAGADSRAHYLAASTKYSGLSFRASSSHIPRTIFVLNCCH
jgi:hypothetical protein